MGRILCNRSQHDHQDNNLLYPKENHQAELYDTILTITLLDHSFVPQATDKFEGLTQ